MCVLFIADVTAEELFNMFFGGGFSSSECSVELLLLIHQRVLCMVMTAFIMPLNTCVQVMSDIEVAECTIQHIAAVLQTRAR